MAEHPADLTHRRLFTAGEVLQDGKGALYDLATTKLIQESLAKWRGLKMTVAAESSDVIAVTCQVVDSAGVAVAEARSFLFEVLGADMLQTLVGAFTLAATTGTEVSTTAKPRILVTATAAGLIVLDVEDIAKASGLTVRLSAQQHEDQASAATPGAYGGYQGSVDFAFD